eukprot:5013274-Prymnesium_polylepis.1
MRRNARVMWRVSPSPPCAPGPSASQESIRPEIRQYFVEGDEEAVPFDRLHRATVYQRAKGVPSAVPFGTRRNVYGSKYEWASHSMFPTMLGEQRVSIGSNTDGCKQPYSVRCATTRGSLSALSLSGATEPRDGGAPAVVCSGRVRARLNP